MPLFADLEPPPHGLTRLRARLARRGRRKALWAGGVLAPAALAATLVALLARPAPMPFDHPALVTVEGVQVIVENGARVAALPLGDGVWLVP